MFRILFKIKRRLALVFKKWRKAAYLLEQRSLYPGRFFVDGSINYAEGFSVAFDASASTVSTGRNLHLRSNCRFRSGNDGKLAIGDNVFFNNDCSITCLQEIVIGNECQFGENVRIYDANHRFRDKSKLISEQGYNGGKIMIGNNCWIGSNTIILKGVSIGDNAVIGANCIIHRSIPAGSVVMNKQDLGTSSY